jgi:hypothetical protein
MARMQSSCKLPCGFDLNWKLVTGVRRRSEREAARWELLCVLECELKIKSDKLSAD